MKRVAAALLIFASLILVAPVWAQNQASFEHGILIYEEKEVFNSETGAGLVRRYYIDHLQIDGLSSTLSVFYKDGREELFWWGWNLYTDQGQYAILLDGAFYTQPKLGPMTNNMITLRAMVNWLKTVTKVDFYGNLRVQHMALCLIGDDDDILITVAGKKACYEIDFTK